MTAYLLFEDMRRGTLKLDDHVVVSARAASLPGARMFLREGESVSVENLLKGMLVQSGNDAAYALIEHAGPGPESFVARMNETAKRLELPDTHFANATGLQNSAHYSSARDLARLAIALRRDFPEFLHLFALRDFTWADIHQPNRNLLLRDPGVDGLKTGHTSAAGFCMIASAERSGMQLIAVLLGAESEQQRARETRALLDYAIRHFETRRLYSARAGILSLPVRGGVRDHAPLGVNEDLYLTLPRGGFEQLRVRSRLPAARTAPVTSGEAIGELNIHYQEQLLRSVPLVAMETVGESGFLKRTIAHVRGWFGVEALAAP